jgi:hypothetical protein
VSPPRGHARPIAPAEVPRCSRSQLATPSARRPRSAAVPIGSPPWRPFAARMRSSKSFTPWKTGVGIQCLAQRPNCSPPVPSSPGLSRAIAVVGPPPSPWRLGRSGVRRPPVSRCEIARHDAHHRVRFAAQLIAWPSPLGRHEGPLPECVTQDRHRHTSGTSSSRLNSCHPRRDSRTRK